MSETIKTDYADTLNALNDMENSLLYAARRPVLASAQRIIIELEGKLRAALSASPSAAPALQETEPPKLTLALPDKELGRRNVVIVSDEYLEDFNERLVCIAIHDLVAFPSSPAGSELPLLPPEVQLAGDFALRTAVYGYSADQMEEYARAALSARATAPAVSEEELLEIFERYGQTRAQLSSWSTANVTHERDTSNYSLDAIRAEFRSALSRYIAPTAPGVADIK